MRVEHCLKVKCVKVDITNTVSNTKCMCGTLFESKAKCANVQVENWLKVKCVKVDITNTLKVKRSAYVEDCLKVKCVNVRMSNTV